MKTSIRNTQRHQVLERMDTNQRQIIFELSEHDASMLLHLIKRELDQEDKVWQPYWQRLAGSLEKSIQDASIRMFRYLKNSGADKFG